jgi:hypothetical protein
VPIQNVKDNKAHSMAERIRQRQYIGGIIVYILNRQGGTNFADFLGGSHHVAYSKSKYNSAVRAKNSILNPALPIRRDNVY